MPLTLAGTSVRDRTAEFSQLVERLKKQPVSGWLTGGHTSGALIQTHDIP
jgi:hypothetical protein